MRPTRPSTEGLSGRGRRNHLRRPDAALRVLAFVVIAQMGQQLNQRVVFAVDVSHDVEGAGG